MLRRLPLFPFAIVMLLLAASPRAAEDSKYTSREFGFTAEVPADWEVRHEVHEGDRFIVSFGLPKVWGEPEQQEIENAVSITAYRRDDIRSLADLDAAETARLADVLVSSSEAPAALGEAHLQVTKHGGLYYRSKVTHHFVNGIGYVIAFTATEGTYDKNIERYEGFLAGLVFTEPLARNADTEIPEGELESADVYYERARKLYAEGPSRAAEVIEAARLALRADPDHLRARRILGLTYYGTGRLEEALEQFDRGLAIGERDGSIQAGFRFFRARTLYYLGRCEEARQILESHWGFWQDGDSLQERYEALYPRVVADCGEEPPADP